MKKVFMAAWPALAALFVAIPVQAVPARWIPTNTINLIDQSVTAATVTGTTVETTLATVNIPGNTIGEAGIVRVTVLFSMNSNANSKSVRVRFGAGGTLVSDLNFANAASQQQIAMVRNRTATSQVFFAYGGTAYSGLGSSAAGLTTGAVDTRMAQDLTISCQLAVSGDTCTLESYTIEVIRP